MTEGEFRWAETLAIYRVHGDQAAVWIAGRMAQLALAKDEAGVTRLGQIAARLDHLQASEGRDIRH